jgi:tetratricopeptide (TPR) repeat protein
MAEELAQYVDGVLTMEAREHIEEHLSGCEACRMVVAETSAFLVEHADTARPTLDSASTPRTTENGRVIPFRRPWTGPIFAALATAAAALLVVQVVQPAWLPWNREARLSAALAPLVAAFDAEPTRPVQGRLSGGFKYAPPPPITRGPGSREWRPETAAAIATVAVNADLPDRERRAAAGVASLVGGKLDDAIATLAESARQDSLNATLHSDLSAAYLERARFATYPDDWTAAVRAADAALAITPGLHEALFNKALAIEGMNDRDRAREAWEEYRRRDPSGPWSEEAAQHAAALAPQKE